MKQEKLDDEFKRIILSEPTLEEIRYLQYSKVLKPLESKICDLIIENRSIIGNTNIKGIFKEALFITEEDAAELITYNGEIYSKSEIFVAITNFVNDRYKEANLDDIEQVTELAMDNIISPLTFEILNQQYLFSLKEEEDNTLCELENYNNLEIQEHLGRSITLGIDEIDTASQGLPAGKVSTIIDMDEKSSHLLANHLAYTSIIEGKNVIYLSFNKTKYQVMLELISRHSKNTKFNGTLSIKELTTSFDEKLYSQVFNDIKDKLNINLKIYDLDDFPIQNIYSMRRFFAIANKKFNEETDNNVDLIIIDGLYHLRLDRKRISITNKRNIEYEYYLFYQDMANKFLGENISIPVVVTTAIGDAFNYESDTYINLNFVSDNIKSFSSVIICTKLNNALIKSNKLELQLLKCPSGNLIDSVLTKAEFYYSMIYPNNEIINEPINDSVRSKRLYNEFNRLEEEIKNKDKKIGEMEREIVNLMTPPKEFDLSNLDPLD